MFVFLITSTQNLATTKLSNSDKEPPKDKRFYSKLKVN